MASDDSRDARPSEDEERSSRERDFSRRELLRAGSAVPIVLSAGWLAACGDDGSSGAHGDHTDAPHDDAAHTDSHTDGASHSDSSGHSDTGHGDGGHSDNAGHNDSATHNDFGRHIDDPGTGTHADQVFTDERGRRIHSDHGRVDTGGYTHTDNGQVVDVPLERGPPNHGDHGDHADAP